MKIFDYKCSSKNYKLSIVNTYQQNEIKKKKTNDVGTGYNKHFDRGFINYLMMN